MAITFFNVFGLSFKPLAPLAPAGGGGGLSFKPWLASALARGALQAAGFFLLCGWLCCKPLFLAALPLAFAFGFWQAGFF